MTRILIIEDDEDIALALRTALEREGAFEILVASDGESGLARARCERVDLVLLDVNLPGLGGMEVCRALRRDPQAHQMPIIMLTARGDEPARIAGLEMGADDYVTKPFSLREVVARVRALLRRADPGEGRTNERLVAGSLELDTASRIVRVAGVEVSLTRKEFDLLAALMHQAGRVLSRERLLERVWGYDYPGETRTVDVHIRQLRRKLGPGAAAHIQTSVGVGYRFRSDP